MDSISDQDLIDNLKDQAQWIREWNNDGRLADMIDQAADRLTALSRPQLIRDAFHITDDEATRLLNNTVDDVQSLHRRIDALEKPTVPDYCFKEIKALWKGLKELQHDDWKIDDKFDTFTGATIGDVVIRFNRRICELERKAGII